MKKWEYNIIGIKQYSTDKFNKLDELGKDGWELVSVISTSETSQSYYFKREKIEKVNPVDEH